MPSVTYVGPHDEIETVLDGKPVVLRHGESIDVSAEQADGLLEQTTNWAKSSTKAAKAAADDAAPTEEG